MSSSEAAVWRITDPAVIAVCEEWKADLTAWNERVTAAEAEWGVKFVTQYEGSGFSTPRGISGIAYSEGGNIPQGWMLYKKNQYRHGRWFLVPSRGPAGLAGRDLLETLAAPEPLIKRLSRDHGLPYDVWGGSSPDGWGRRVWSWGFEWHADVPYLVIDQEAVAHLASMPKWAERVKLSAYYAMREAETERESAPSPA